MNWRYILGAAANRGRHALMRRAPALRAIPYGNWLYDLRRFGGNRLGAIFDVGANVGQTAWGLVRYFPDDPLYCFEPVERTFATLERRYGTRAHCVKAALGSRIGTAEINTFADSELNTLSEPGALARSRRGSVETIHIDTLDAFTARAGIDAIGLLKMDVQGWEIEVLDGATRLLAARAIRFILTEVGFNAGDRDMVPFGTIDTYLSGHGYVFAGLYDTFRYGPTRQYVGFSNALYVLAES